MATRNDPNGNHGEHIDLTMADITLSPTSGNYSVNPTPDLLDDDSEYNTYNPPTLSTVDNSAASIITDDGNYSAMDSVGVNDDEDSDIDETTTLSDDTTATPDSDSSPETIRKIGPKKKSYRDEENQHDQLPSIEEVRNMSIMMLQKADQRISRSTRLSSSSERSIPSVEEVRRMSSMVLKKAEGISSKNRKSWKKIDGYADRSSKQSAIKRAMKACACTVLALASLLLVGIFFFGAVHSYRSASKLKVPNAESPSTGTSGNSEYRASRMAEVTDFLSSYSDYNALITLGTPQNLAATWIADLDERNVPVKASSQFLQRYALAVFFYSTGGQNFWPRDLGFLSPDDECLWFELGYDNVDNELEIGASCLGTKEIRSLVFAPQNLQGTLPDELGLLSNLEHLSIFRNPKIVGPFPEFLKNMRRLNHVMFNSCTFESSIPTWIGDLKSLNTLQLSNNHIIGSIPSEINKLTNLKSLALDNNNLLGSVNVFESLVNLQVLIAKNNFLHGILGRIFFEKLQNLKVLDLSVNQINSTLPNNMYSSESLTIIDLHSNKIDGHLPVVPTRNGPYTGKLQFLSLNENQIKGPIPSTLSHLTSLDHLDLSSNQLSGTIPEELGLMTNLQYLLLDKNNFKENGKVPTFIDSLKNLKGLSLP